MLINPEGIIASRTFTDAHVDERDTLWELLLGIEALFILDKDLIGADYLQKLLHHSGIDLQTAGHRNMETHEAMVL